MERYLRVNLLGLGPRLMKKEFTGSRSHTALTQCASSGQATEGHRGLRIRKLQSEYPCNAHYLWITLPFHIKISTLLMKYSELVNRVLRKV